GYGHLIRDAIDLLSVFDDVADCLRHKPSEVFSVQALYARCVWSIIAGTRGSMQQGLTGY
ncbi:MAG TPA: hypothetical protein VGV87_12270, partial [Blastocatellia bacterium]|nr:hypothetical protein [Blastocatellia bacterium]